ncbi:MAG: cysteine desulfurase [Cellulosilyticum sp.]|nr:cysteine desulfurase [Cellulosilyticum sp.]
MIYLDYAADTPVRKEVLERFNKVSETYFANPNANHALGKAAKACIEEATLKIAQQLKIKPEELIFTSGATEANNLAIKGVAEQYGRKGKHIITSYLEHSSVTGPLSYLQEKGFEVDFVQIMPDGRINLEHLQELLRPDTILISFAAVDSELGVIQDLRAIRNLIKDYPNCLFHVDATQAIGKISVDLELMDLMTFTAHKLYGIHGIGALVKKEKIYLTPIVHGGLSTTPFRSGTPTLALIDSMNTALEFALKEQEACYEKVLDFNQQIRKALSGYPEVYINSDEKVASPYIINISLKGIKASEMQQKLEEREIYVSTKSACVTPNTPSRPVLALSGDRKRALSTLRISLGHLTTQEEIHCFIEAFDASYKELK